MRHLIFLLLIIGAIYAQTTTSNEFTQSTEASSLELARDWKLLSIFALLGSTMLVAIAYMVGIGFEMPEIKGWANNELSQIFANAIIIVALIGTIIFLDVIAQTIVLGSGVDIPICSDITQSCLKSVATAYLGNYTESAKLGAEKVIADNVEKASLANRRIGLYCLTIYCLQVGVTTTIAGHYILDMDMNAILFEYYTNLLSSMRAQQFFVEQISFNMGPVILAVGIVARSFFFTRKIGGLLIAAAVGIMFFFPLMYIFDWVTLDTALAGDKGIGDSESSCPIECRDSAPLAYVQETGEPFTNTLEIYAAFDPEDGELASRVIGGDSEFEIGSNGSYDGRTIVSCNYGDYALCPVICRELPYPGSVPLCIRYNISSDVGVPIPVNAQEVCAQMPVECKIIRTVPVPDAAEQAMCPESCLIVPPLKNDCRYKDNGEIGNCLQSSFDCRVTNYDDMDWRPSKADAGQEQVALCNLARDCVESTNAFESCVYVFPETGSCDDLCEGCPTYCRIEGGDIDNMADSCKDGDQLIAACQSCTESCKVNIEIIQNLPGEQCTSCPDERRIVSATLPNNYTQGDCSTEPDVCPTDSDHRVAIPRTACETCLFTQETYAFDPPINLRCSDLCAPTDTAPVKASGSYTGIGGEGLVGRSEIQNVAKLIIPAYLLPLFNIVATLIFIKGLSGILGGDIDIPGMSKVF